MIGMESWRSMLSEKELIEIKSKKKGDKKQMAWKNADRESRAGEETMRFMLTKRDPHQNQEERRRKGEDRLTGNRQRKPDR